MEIKVLIENMTYNQNLKGQHGLSMLVTTDKIKILFDTGANGDFLCNAVYMEEEMKDIDYVIISHGHYDHCGGLESFIKINKHAKIIMSKNGDMEKYSKSTGEMRFIGLNMPMNYENEIIWVDDYYKINDEIEVFGKIKKSTSFEHGDKNLFIKENEQFVPDNFDDEIYLTIKKDEKLNLITGCAHKGIINIIREISDSTNIKLFHSIIGGFHLSKAEVVQMSNTLRGLMDVNADMILTNHCTGIEKYAIMKGVFGEKIKYFHTGDKFTF